MLTALDVSVLQVPEINRVFPESAQANERGKSALPNFLSVAFPFFLLLCWRAPTQFKIAEQQCRYMKISVNSDIPADFT